MAILRSTFWMAAAIVSLCLLSAVGAAPKDGGDPASAAPPTRILAPGVETTIPLQRAEEETADLHEIVELSIGVPGLEWQPQEFAKSNTLYSKSQDVIFRRGVWQLQITFKPPRLIKVDIPQEDGKMKSKVIWYMVYRITNPGSHMTPEQAADERFHEGKHSIKEVDSGSEMFASVGEHRFVPTFLLRTFTTEELAVNKDTVQYTDQIIPAARRAIYLRERPNCRFKEFFDTVQISGTPIPVSSERDEISRYGVVTWMDIDPRIDYFSIQIMGLTNAY
ncbi:MAG: hypothetical protein N2C12_14655, partial [Planctomycetales bacterium]